MLQGADEVDADYVCPAVLIKLGHPKTEISQFGLENEATICNDPSLRLQNRGSSFSSPICFLLFFY